MTSAGTAAPPWRSISTNAPTGAGNPATDADHAFGAHHAAREGGGQDRFELVDKVIHSYATNLYVSSAAMRAS